MSHHVCNHVIKIQCQQLVIFLYSMNCYRPKTECDAISRHGSCKVKVAVPVRTGLSPTDNLYYMVLRIGCYVWVDFG